MAAGNEGDMDGGERGGILVMGAAVVRRVASCGDEIVCAGDGGVIVVVSGGFCTCCGCGGFGARTRASRRRGSGAADRAA